MKRLYLMRHAKSDRSNPSAEDHDRPLNARGRSATPLMGEWLRARGAEPDEVLVSSAARTLETLDRLRRSLEGLPRPRVETVLYLADADTLMARLRCLPAAAGAALLIGHQPGLGELLRVLLSGEPPAHCRPALGHLPTAAVAVLEADIGDWQKLGPGTARFIDYAAPRTLLDEAS